MATDSSDFLKDRRPHLSLKYIKLSQPYCSNKSYYGIQLYCKITKLYCQILAKQAEILPRIRGSPAKKAQQTERRKRTSGHLWRGFSNDRTNQIITFGLIGRSDEHRTQTTLKHASCFADKKYLHCAALGNQVHTSIVSQKRRHEGLKIPEMTLGWNTLKLLNYALVVSSDAQSRARFCSADECLHTHTLYFHTVTCIYLPFRIGKCCV